MYGYWYWTVNYQLNCRLKLFTVYTENPVCQCRGLYKWYAKMPDGKFPLGLVIYHLLKQKAIYRPRLGHVRSQRWPWRIANGKDIFHSDILVANFGLLFKTFRLFRKFSDRSSQNCHTIYIPTDISGILGLNGKEPKFFQFADLSCQVGSGA